MSRETIHPAPREPDQSARLDPNDLLAAYLVNATHRASLIHALALTHRDPIPLADALYEIAASQRDPMGEAACLFLAQQAEANHWGFIPGAGFISTAGDRDD